MKNILRAIAVCLTVGATLQTILVYAGDGGKDKSTSRFEFERRDISRREVNQREMSQRENIQRGTQESRAKGAIFPFSPRG